MKGCWFSAILFVLLILSCSTRPELSPEVPEWFRNTPEDSPEMLFFRTSGEGHNISAARSTAIENLNQSLVKALDLKDSDSWLPEGKEAVNQFLNIHRSIILQDSTPEDVQGVRLIHSAAWKNNEGNIIFAIEIAWLRKEFKKRKELINTLTNNDSPRYLNLEKRAQHAERDRNFYEAALIWATAAGEAQSGGNFSSYQNALQNIKDALSRIEFKQESIPAEVFAGLLPPSPFVFLAKIGNKTVGNAEFLISYPQILDGRLTTSQASVISDNDGRITFRPPGINQVGTWEVSIAPSFNPFLAYLTEDNYSENASTLVEVDRIVISYDTLPRLRLIPMGILVLETDLTGNPLNENDTAEGLADDLLADGFNVSIINIDPEELSERTSREILRDLKADKRYSEVYERVLHGTVSLESFQQDGDNYTVQVSGKLLMSDIKSQANIYVSNITKTSQASNSQQAISTAFRQFGRSFAEEIIAQSPK